MKRILNRPLFRWLLATILLTVLACLWVLLKPLSSAYLLILGPTVALDWLFDSAWFWVRIADHYGSFRAVLFIATYLFVLFGVLFAPLLASSRRRFLVLTVCVYLGIPAGLLMASKTIHYIQSPQSIELRAPEVLIDELPFDDFPRSLQWSPSGKYIAVSGSTDFYTNHTHEAFLVEFDKKRVVARIPDAHDCFWSTNDILWIHSTNNWRLYAAPTFEMQAGDARLPSSRHVDPAPESWTFRPDKRLLAEVLPHGDEAKKLSVWRGHDLLWEKEFTPRSPGSQRKAGLSFSPSGDYVAIVVTGWIAYEQPGAEELWLVNLDTGEIRFLYEGRKKDWFIWDYPVQAVRPSWSPDEQHVVFGGGEFNVEKMHVESTRRLQILPRKTAGWHPRLSPTGKWLGYSRPWAQSDSGEDNPMAVASADGKKFAQVPKEFVCWSMGAWSWHPNKDIWAWCTDIEYDDPFRVFVWHIEKP